MFAPLRYLGRQIGRLFAAGRGVLRARFDAAQTTTGNANHWAMSDSHSARGAHSESVRRTVRERARYEVANNSWASGIVQTLSHHTIGIGPRLQLLSSNEDANRRVERAFAKWCRSINLAEKLLIAKETQVRDGEVFALITRNKQRYPIQLDVRLYEADQVTSPRMGATFDPSIDDGIKISKEGVAESYYFLDQHPGDPTYTILNEGQWYDAKDVLHYFRSYRPGQLRGISAIMPALPLFAQLRRYALSVLRAAENAANMSMYLSTTSSAVEAAESPADFATMPTEPGMLTVTPEGWAVTQVKSEQPITTYDAYTRSVLNEISRCLNMPYNIAACNSAGYNYSSGRLDHQTYYKSIEVDQGLMECMLLDRIFRAWLEEAVYVSGLLDGLPQIDELDHQWCWDAEPVIDESTDANASETRLKTGRSTLPLEWQRQGYNDPDVQLAKGAKALGLTIEQYQARIAAHLFGPAPEESLATDTPMKDAALDGGQISSLLLSLQAVSGGTLPAETARGMIQSSFPFLTPEQIDSIILPLAEFKPTALPDGSPVPVADAATDPNAPNAGAFVGTKRRDFTNNQKQTNEVLDAFKAGGSETLTLASLLRLGWSEDMANKFIDDMRDGRIDSPELQPQEVTP